MLITTDIELRGFEFWAGAVNTYNALTFEQLDEVESYLDELYPDGMSETELNDLFWFDADWIAEILGFEDFEDLENAND
jgi:hypothetical protein